MTTRRESGSATVEVAVVAPLAIVLLCLVAFVGRAATARQHVDGAARDAARAASLERSAADATSAAEHTAASALGAEGLACMTTGVEVDTTGFAPGGQVTVTVTCALELSDLGLLGLPGTRTLEATAVSVVDRWRAAT